MVQPVIFISYSHVDEHDKNRLQSHLNVLQSVGLIEVWCDDQIKAGGDWRSEIHNYIERANVAIFLITPSFLNSVFIKQVEVPRLLERHKNKELNIFPIIARPCAWKFVPWLAALNVRPKNGKPVWRQGGHVETALADIAEEVANILGEVIESPGNHKFLSPEPPTTKLKGSKSLKTGKIFISKKLKWSVLALAIIVFCLWAFTFRITTQNISEVQMFPPLSVQVYSPKYVSPNENENIRLGVYNGQDSDISAKLRLVKDNSKLCFISGVKNNTIHDGQMQSRGQITQDLTVLFPWDMSQSKNLGAIAGLGLWGKINDNPPTEQKLSIRIAPLPWIRLLRYYSGLLLLLPLAFFLYVLSIQSLKLGKK